MLILLDFKTPSPPLNHAQGFANWFLGLSPYVMPIRHDTEILPTNSMNAIDQSEPFAGQSNYSEDLDPRAWSL